MMSAMKLDDFRRLMKTHPSRARQAWDDGMPVAFSTQDCQTAIACMNRADFSHHRFAAMAALATSFAPQTSLPDTLLQGIEMATGWVGVGTVEPANHPLHQIGAAMVVVGLAAASGLHRLAQGAVRRDATAGVVFSPG